MSPIIHGIHHVTAIGGDPVANLDFYTRVLGLRLVKRTVNFDDPSTWHLYFGDRFGSPGTIMTFFPHPLARPGRAGSGEVARSALAVPPGALPSWLERLDAEGLMVAEVDEGDRRALHVQDVHGTRLALVESPGQSAAVGWPTAGISAEMAIRGFDRVVLSVREVEPTAAFLAEVLGLVAVGRAGDRRWFDAGGGQRVEVAAAPDGNAARARLGAGSVHHVAFRVPDDDAQAALRQRLIAADLHVTEVQDRQYFRSIYFREPGGVIFEIATDVPSFTVDEPEAELGRSLKLPPWLEPSRAALEQALPPLAREVTP